MEKQARSTRSKADPHPEKPKKKTKRNRDILVSQADRGIVEQWVSSYRLERVAKVLAEVSRGVLIGDRHLYSNLVDDVGEERLAQIAGRLVANEGHMGAPEKPDILMLVKMAHLSRQSVDRPHYALAKEVARETCRAGEESRITKLRHHFERWRPALQRLAQHAPVPTHEEIADEAKARLPEKEYRARAALLNMIPGAIDLYRLTFMRAKRRDANLAEDVRQGKRREIEPLTPQILEARRPEIERLLTAQIHYFQSGGNPNRNDPRGFRDEIEMLASHLPTLLAKKNNAARLRRFSRSRGRLKSNAAPKK
jgi:hypothetical protein